MPTYPTMERLLRGVEPEVRNRDLTRAEMAQAFLEEQLRKVTTPARARKLSMTAFGGSDSGIPGGMGAIDVVPFLGSAKGLEEGGRDISQGNYDLESGRYGDALRNYGSAVLGVLPGAAGAVKVAPGLARAIKAAPQDEALRLAQLRAALPPSQGGLGLPANNTPIERAQAMGFVDPVYHATDADIDFVNINPSVRGKLGAGVYTSPNAGYTEKYVGDNARILPLLTRGQYADAGTRTNLADDILENYGEELKTGRPDFKIKEWKARTNEGLQGMGYSGVDVGEERLVFNPEDVRSRFAAFDPFRRDAATAAAFGLAAPDLLAKEKAEESPKKGKAKKNSEGSLPKATK